MLKKINYISIPLIAVILSFSCQKIDIRRINKVYTDSMQLSGTSLIAYGKIVDISDAGISKYGFCFSTQEEPTIYNSLIEYNEPTGAGQFFATLDNINFAQTYFIRAFVQNEEEIIYGNTLTFSIVDLNGLTVVTNPASIISASSVSITGNISGIGSLTLKDFGHCWSTAHNPTINEAKTSFGSLQKDSAFKSDITGLPFFVTYYVRTYIKADNNTVIYGNEQSFTIPDLVVHTDTFSFPNSTDVTLIGTITSLGVNPVMDHGFCWSYTTSQPNMNDHVVSLGATNNTGQFPGGINNILSGITYYYRAYATDGIYVKYGGIKKFEK